LQTPSAARLSFLGYFAPGTTLILEKSCFVNTKCDTAKKLYDLSAYSTLVGLHSIQISSWTSFNRIRAAKIQHPAQNLKKASRNEKVSSTAVI